MKYNFELNQISKSGMHSVSFHCEHCQQTNLYIGACLYTAKLSVDPRVNLNEASKEFVDNINNRKYSMFDNKKAAKHLKTAVCNCNANVVSMKAHKAKVKAKKLLNAGLNKIHKRHL